MQKPTSTNGRRIAAAMFLGAASTAMVAGTAHADGVTGAKFENTGAGGSVPMTDDSPDHASNARLIGLAVPGSSNELWTYCIQKTVELNQDETYNEHAWSDAGTGISTQHLEGIKWILNNSYPQLDLGHLANASGISGLTDKEAAEGTQAAIWNLSEDGKTALDTTAEKDQAVIDLYHYLVSAATNTNNLKGAPPQASLSLTPVSKAAPQAGSKVAFTLTSNTSAGSISVALNDAHKTGAKLVDAGGRAISAHATFKAGDTVYVQLPSTPTSGDVSLTATGTVSGIQAGRVFLSADGAPSQNLILAQAENTPVSASADVKWVPATVPTTTPSSSPSTAPSSHPSTSAPS
uniref:thioester domain-containing protein n=1 Tax=Catenulispora rubra TaxID=280293 RepID=UPI00189232BB